MIKFNNSKANDSKIIKGNKYRFTVITSRLIRMEFQKDGLFEDRPTQVVLDRNFEDTKFSVTDTEDFLKIETERLVLNYNKKEFSTDGLSITIKASNVQSSSTSVWRFGTFDGMNLLGTCRTLDAINGETELEKGLVSKSGYSLIDDSKSLVFNDNNWIEPRKADSVDLYFFGYDRDYKGCIRDFYKLSGNTPLIPRFALGNWWSRYWEYSQDEYTELIEKFKEENVPLSVCIIDMDWHLVNIDKKYGNGWTGFTWNKELFPDYKKFIEYIHDNNIKTALNLHPAEGIRGHEDAYLDVAKEMGVDYENEEPVKFDVASKRFMDVYFDKVIHPMEEKDGIDFWWLDWQQEDVSTMKGLDPLWMINHLHYKDLSRDGKRGFTFSRWPGFSGHRYPIGFSGDTLSTWESLKFQPYFTSTAANVGYGWWSHDIGGHMQGNFDEELYLRWVEFGVFSPIMRLHCCKSEFVFREPWNYSKEIKDSAEEYLRFRHKLIPYLYTMAYRNTKDLIPLMLPLYYENQFEEKAYKYKNEYYFGSELLVLPVTDKVSKVTRKALSDVYLPSGTWFDFFNGIKYEGNVTYPIYSSIDECPVFAKAGAIVPLASYDKVNDYSNPNKLDVIVFGGKSNSFTLYEDDGETCDYLENKNVMTKLDLDWNNDGCIFTIGNVDDKNLIPKHRSWNVRFRGFSITDNIKVNVDGKEVTFKSYYDDKANSLVVSLNDIAVNNTIEIKIISNSLLMSDYNRIEKIKDIIKYANVSIDDKTYLEYNLSLFKDCDVNQKVLDIMASHINEELKKVIIAELLK